jgi:hypothetical protein
VAFHQRARNASLPQLHRQSHTDRPTANDHNLILSIHV